MTWQLASLRVNEQREKKEGDTMPFYGIVLEVRHHYFCLSLFIKSKSLSLVHSQEEGNRLCLLKGMSMNLWAYLKPLQGRIRERQREPSDQATGLTSVEGEKEEINL